MYRGFSPTSSLIRRPAKCPSWWPFLVSGTFQSGTTTYVF